MSMFGLFLGNDYPGTAYSLPDCVLDAERMFAVMQPYLAPESELLRNDECTLANIVRWVRATQKQMQPGDVAEIYNSGHGTSERVGNKQLQGIVLTAGVVLWEDKIRELANLLSPAIFISDSCFADGLTRAVGRQPRYIAFSRLNKRRQIMPAGRMPRRQHDYFAACAANETADSTGDGGAFTNVLLDVLKTASKRTTMQGIYNRVRKQLPNAEHPQTPQFYASDKGFANRTLASFMGAK